MAEKTPLYDKHLEYGGKMVDFAGWLLPVQYPNGVMAEHKAVRSAAGLFDVSHMGQALVRGEGAEAALQMLLTNDMAGMEVGRCRYSPMCNEAGGVVDDVIVCKTAPDAYLVVLNAANCAKDLAWMRDHLPAGVQLRDQSAETALLALQGPRAAGILAGITEGGGDALPQKNYTFAADVKVAGTNCMVSRTGYTGEDGFELYCAPADASALWDALLAAGRDEGLVPCGLGARDTLRLEAAMPLYGHEMDEVITPLQAGLGMFVKLDKPDFIGKMALVDGGAPTKRRTGLRVTGRGIAREGDKVYDGDEQVGVVTSGTQLPWLGWPGAMALLAVKAREPGKPLWVEVRGRRVEAEVVPLPFYKRSK